MTRDCQEDRPHISLDPYPLRFLTDPEGELTRAVGAGLDGHWKGFISKPVTIVVDQAGIVRWIYTGDGSVAPHIPSSLTARPSSFTATSTS